MIDINTKNRQLVFLYHFPCPDGFTAAWAAHQKYSYCATFLPESHSFTETKKLLADPRISEMTIVFLDICCSRNQLEQLHKLTNGNVLVLDHHQTTEEQCGDLPYVYIDKTRSGAGITWDTLHDTPRPFIIDLVEDRDIWKWEIPNAQQYLLWLDTVHYTFDNWTQAAEWLNDPKTRKEMLTKGMNFKEFKDWILYQRILTHRKIHKLTLKNHELPCVNMPVFQSQLGNYLATCSPCGAAAIYYRDATHWHFSLRSIETGIDVAKLAEKYGGGGHKHAAGFRVKSLSELDTIEYGDWDPDVRIHCFSNYTETELDTHFSEIPYNK